MNAVKLSRILSWVAVGGVGLTGFLSARCARKAALKEEKKEKALCYLPAVVSGAATCGCILYGNRVSTKEIVALAGTCGYLAKKSEQQGAFVPSKKDRNDICAEASRWNGQSIEETGKGDVLFLEGYSGRLFKSSIEAVKKAEKQFTYEYARMWEEHTALCLNDFYRLLGINETHFGWQMGWTSNEDWSDTEPPKFTNTWVEEPDGGLWVIEFDNYPSEGWYEI